MNNQMEYVLSFSDIYENGETIYLSSGCFNGLIECNTDGKILNIERFPGIMPCDRFSHRNIYKIGNSLFFTPDFARGIHRLDMTSNKILYYPIDSLKNVKYRCADSYLWDGRIWLFGAYKSNSVICFDPKTNLYEAFDTLVEAIPVENEKRIIFHTKLAYNNEYVYGVKNNSNEIVCMNLKSKTSKIIAINGFNNFYGVTYLDWKIYITMYNTCSVVQYDLKTGTAKKIELEKSLSECRMPFIYAHIITYKSQIYLVNSQACYVAIIQDNKIKKFCDFPEGYSLLHDLNRGVCKPFYNINIWENGIQFFPAGANMMIRVDVKQKKAFGLKVTVEKRWIDNEYTNQYFSECMNNAIRDNVLVYENEWAGLKTFVNYLCKDI